MLDISILPKITDQSKWVLYRRPNEAKVHFIIQNNHEVYQKGFVISSFDNDEKQYIYPEYSFVFDQNDLLCLNISINLKDKKQNATISEQDYCNLIQKTIITLRKGTMAKVVLSRTKTINYNFINLIASYKNLCEAQPNAFVYLYQLPNHTIWMGATPELLLQKKDNHYHTMALAGTKNNQPNTQWTDKEYEEQKMVTDYILLSLGGDKNITMDGPHSFMVGEFSHLKTNIIFQLTDDAMLDNTLSTLHPTPAVCGLPKDEALAYIKSNEVHKRKYYTGFLGINDQQEKELYVNLRCVEVFKNHSVLYLGGGITTKSIPQKEWEETELKAKTILKQLIFK